MDMFKSATKMVLVTMVFTSCFGLLLPALAALLGFTNPIPVPVDPKDFTNYLMMVLAFYFGRNTATPTSTGGSTLG